MSKVKTVKQSSNFLISLAGVAVLLLVAFIYFNNSQNGRQAGSGINKGNCLADDCLAVQDLNYPAGTLPSEVKEALDEAIADEYKALSVYQAVVAKFGQVRPFSMIKGAEEQHIASLKAIYDKYGLMVPANKTAKITSPSTIQLSCQLGVDAEIANYKLYQDKLLPSVKNYEDITIVFTRLMNASKDKHFPAFERCN